MDELQKVERMIEKIEAELKTKSSADQMKNQRVLLNAYKKKRDRLKER